jgi:16S rRNA (cytosine967-C5)-methyltransferase
VPAGDEALDVPDWLAPRLRAALGADYAAVMQAMRHRAPVFLRVNAARIGRGEAIAAGRRGYCGAPASPWRTLPWK